MESKKESMAMINKVEEIKNREELARAMFPDVKPSEHWFDRYPSRELPKGAKVTRFAPSPTGSLHIGGVLTALINEAEARRTGGVFILRIEDTDRVRFKEGAEESIYKGLEWIGVRPDEGGFGGAGKYGPYRQSERLDIYKSFTKELVVRGNAYPCFCSREELKLMREEQDKKGLSRMYSGKCRNLSEDEIKKNISEGKKYTIRLRVPEGETIEWRDLSHRAPIRWETKNIDDQVLLKSDGFPTYHLANVVDDRLMGINRIYRGEEWMSSTPKHLLLYKYLGWEPPEFGHLVLLRQLETQQKLSKRKGEAGIEWYEREGYLPEAVRNFLTRIIWAHPKGLDVYSHDDFVKDLDVSGMGDSAPQVNPKLLEHINQQYLANLSPKERFEKIIEWAGKFEPNLKEVFEKHPKDAESYLSIEPDRMKKLSEAKEIFGFYFDEFYAKPAAEEVAKEAGGDLKRAMDSIKAYLKDYYNESDEHDEWEKKVRGCASSFGIKDKNMFMILRLVLAGTRFSPPLYDIMKALGKEKVVNRLAGFVEKSF